MLTSEELEAIRGRADGATKPPWGHEPQASLSTRPRAVVMAKRVPGLGWLIGEEITEPDATFIAHARTDVPALLAMVDELEDINGGLRAWQDVARPKLEARIGELEAELTELKGDCSLCLGSGMTGHPDDPARDCARCDGTGRPPEKDSTP